MFRKVTFLLMILTITFTGFSFAQKKIIILPLGDSITSGQTGSSEGSGYRRILHILLTAHNYNVKFVGSSPIGKDDFDNQFDGKGGWHAYNPDSTNDIAKNIIGWLNKLPQENKPEYILLHIGTNDIQNGDNADSVISDVHKILDNIDKWEKDNSKSITVILAKIINRNDSLTSSEKSQITSEYNDKLDQLLSERSQDKIILIDMENGTGFDYRIDTSKPFDSGDLVDNLHPNDNGYQKIAFKWYSTLKDILPVENNPVLNLLSPGNNTVHNGSVNLIWSADPAAEKYRVQVSLDSLFTNTLFYDSKTANQNIYSTELTINNLPEKSILYWRVISLDSVNATTWRNLNYSIIGEFKTDPNVISPVTLSSPANNIAKADTFITFEWLPEENSVTYELQISTNSNFTNFFKKITGITNTNETVTGFNFGTQYYWRVISYNAANESATSLTRKFVTKFDPPANFLAVAKVAGKVDLSWDDKLNNENGFIIERKVEGGTYSKIAQLAANITTYEDKNVSDSTSYLYRIKVFNSIAESNFSGDVKVTTLTGIASRNEIPEKFELFQNYPNPFNPSTSIKFSIPDERKVRLTIYNSIGKEIAILTDEFMSAGVYEYKFDGNSLSSGIYFYKLEIGNFIEVKKMMLVK